MATTAILTALGVGIYLLTQEDSNALVKTNNIGNDAIIKDNSNLKNIVSNNKNKSLKLLLSLIIASFPILLVLTNALESSCVNK
jgi:hypothetical protein